MKPNRMKSFFLIVLLIAVTGAAMAYSSGKAKTLFSSWTSPKPHPTAFQSGIVHIGGNLIQNKILQGSDGTVNLSLTIKADDVMEHVAAEARHVDMVIVLENAFKFKIREEKEIRDIVTLGDIHNFVINKIREVERKS